MPTVACPRCNQAVLYPDNLAGTVINCSNCRGGVCDSCCSTYAGRITGCPRQGLRHDCRGAGESFSAETHRHGDYRPLPPAIHSVDLANSSPSTEPGLPKTGEHLCFVCNKNPGTKKVQYGEGTVAFKDLWICNTCTAPERVDRGKYQPRGESQSSERGGWMGKQLLRLLVEGFIFCAVLCVALGVNPKLVTSTSSSEGPALARLVNTLAGFTMANGVIYFASEFFATIGNYQ